MNNSLVKAQHCFPVGSLGSHLYEEFVPLLVLGVGVRQGRHLAAVANTPLLFREVMKYIDIHISIKLR